MNILALNHHEDHLPAGDHRFQLQPGARYVIFISAENGGATSLLTKHRDTDTEGVEDPDFVSGEVYSTVYYSPKGTYLYITLAGEEVVTIRLHKNPED